MDEHVHLPCVLLLGVRCDHSGRALWGGQIFLPPLRLPLLLMRKLQEKHPPLLDFGIKESSTSES